MIVYAYNLIKETQRMYQIHSIQEAQRPSLRRCTITTSHHSKMSAPSISPRRPFCRSTQHSMSRTKRRAMPTVTPLSTKKPGSWSSWSCRRSNPWSRAISRSLRMPAFCVLLPTRDSCQSLHYSTATSKRPGKSRLHVADATGCFVGA